MYYQRINVATLKFRKFGIVPVVFFAPAVFSTDKIPEPNPVCTLGNSDQNNIAISNLLLCKNAQSLIAVDSHIDELSMWYI